MVCFQPPSLLIGKVRVSVMHFCTYPIHCKVNLGSGQEARIVLIDFSAAFDKVDHHCIAYKLCSVGIGVSVLSLLTQIQSHRSQYVTVDDCRSKLVNVVSGMPSGSVLGPFLFLLYTTELIPLWKIS